MKIGKVKISDTIIEITKGGDNSYMKDLLSVFTPIHVEHRPHYLDYVYTGICNDFAEVKEGDSIPFYNATIKDKTVEFKIQ